MYLEAWTKKYDETGREYYLNKETG